MINQKIIIYQISPLYQILKELNQELNFEVIEMFDENSLNVEIKNLNNYIVVTKEKFSNFENQIILNNSPIKILKLIEKINVKFIKNHFQNQSKIRVKNYFVNLNSRELSFKDSHLKLTEKEVKIILYLFNSDKETSINELQKNVWGYQTDIETHTVETHIYRLRKKILSTFNDENFIESKKNGYQIK